MITKVASLQNCLAICGFDMIFYDIFSGWDGPAADSTMFYDAHMTSISQVINITLQMLAYSITFQNGAGPNRGGDFFIQYQVVDVIST